MLDKESTAHADSDPACDASHGLEVYRCTSTTQNYLGECPVVRCPANIGEDHPSGCMHVMLNYKARLGEAEIGHVLRLKKRVVRRQMREGQEEIASLIALEEFLQAVRQAAADHKHYCGKCGVLRSNAGVCLRGDACSYRARVTRSLGNRHPLNVPVFSYTAPDIWKMLHWRKLLPPEHNLQALLGIDDEAWRYILQQRTLV